MQLYHVRVPQFFEQTDLTVGPLRIDVVLEGRKHLFEGVLFLCLFVDHSPNVSVGTAAHLSRYLVDLGDVVFDLLLFLLFSETLLHLDLGSELFRNWNRPIINRNYSIDKLSFFKIDKVLKNNRKHSFLCN